MQLNPHSVPVAISEILLILTSAALVGWILAKMIAGSRVKALNEAIEERKIELAACRAAIQKSPQVSISLIGKASKTSFPNYVPASSSRDDLKVIEGIGPKIEELLSKEGIFSYSTLSETSPIRISSILKNAGPRFQIQDPTSWPKQALLARDGKWEELEALKRTLISGRQVG